MSILKILGIILAIIVVIGVVIYGIGYFGTLGNEKITPDGNITGKALIVYDPGYSGAPKNVADSMAQDLKSKGYEVKLAGVRSNDASNVSGYKLLIVGGPTYAGNPSGAIDSYLKGLNLSNNITVSVFSVGSGADDQDSNKVMQQILENKTIKVKESIKFDSKSVQNDYSNYVNKLFS